MTSQNDIRKWLLRGKSHGATHIIIACDTFDWSDYPVYVRSNENVRDKVIEVQNKSMQKVMEIYNLSLPLEHQLEEERAWHLGRDEPPSEDDEFAKGLEFILDGQEPF